MRAILALAVVALALSACGARVKLSPREGRAMPVRPETAAAAPTVEQLLTPDSQARPRRSDEQLKRSEQRREDRFDLPPTG